LLSTFLDKSGLLLSILPSENLIKKFSGILQRLKGAHPLRDFAAQFKSHPKRFENFAKFRIEIQTDRGTYDREIFAPIALLVGLGVDTTVRNRQKKKKKN
jgi:hypothetical protein